MAKSHPVDETRTDAVERPKRQRRLNAKKTGGRTKTRNGKRAGRVSAALAAEANQRPVNRRNNRPASICSADKKVRR